jgi:peptidoglycan-associated lipoprotein
VTCERWKGLISAVALSAMLTLTGCAKKVAKTTPPPPPPPAAPTATLAANPSTVEEGQSTTLSWQTRNATDVTISGLGILTASGARSVAPTTSTTYTLLAKGPGGTQDASARVTVNPKIAAATPSPSDEELFSKTIKDIFFDYDKSGIRPGEAPSFQTDGAFLSQHPNVKVLIEGHCDDRGSEEYNIALGTSRAESVRQRSCKKVFPGIV